jgi:putative Flp pilus-assembly TadE/G-like protein
MRNRLQHLRRDERGMSLVFVGMGFMAFLAATTLAIDVGMFMTARSQAQNAADAGAHAGAVALALNSFSDRSSTGPAVQSAINAAKANGVMGIAPSIGPSDVTFPLSPSGAANRVKVVVYRDAAHVDAGPVPTLLGSIFGVNTVDITATATGEAAPANAMTCVKPFMIPDKWTEHVDGKCIADGTWTTGSTFDEFNSKTNVPCSNPDVYVPASNPTGYTGYTVANDVGTELVLREANQNSANPSFYYSWKMPNDVGGNFYRDNIATCNTSVLVYDPDNPVFMIQEPGSKQGPTIQGIQDLIDKDPDAVWNQDCKCVRNSKYTGQSPRVFPIPLFNPQYYAEGIAQGRGASFMLANFLGFFVTYVDNSNGIHGIITNITGIVDPNVSTTTTNMFPMAIRLVQ